MLLHVGACAPNFTLLDDSGNPFHLKDFRGHKIILYFYPKDNTPGCTQQACAFRDVYSALLKEKILVLGISKDPAIKHASFKAKYSLPFTLLADIHGEVCDLYGIFKEKSLFGKTFMGIQRTTFLIDEAGNIQYIWRKVKVKNHVEEVLEEAIKTVSTN